MDPNEALRIIREIVRSIVDDGNEDFYASLELAETFDGLDEWIKGGGFLPKAWKPRVTEVVPSMSANSQWLNDNPGKGFVALLDGEPIHSGPTFASVVDACRGHGRIREILFARRSSPVPSISVGDKVRLSDEYLKKSKSVSGRWLIERGSVYSLKGSTATVKWDDGETTDVDISDLHVSLPVDAR
jgi:hypothetical protein